MFEAVRAEKMICAVDLFLRWESRQSKSRAACCARSARGRNLRIYNIDAVILFAAPTAASSFTVAEQFVTARSRIPTLSATYFPPRIDRIYPSPNTLIFPISISVKITLILTSTAVETELDSPRLLDFSELTYFIISELKMKYQRSLSCGTSRRKNLYEINRVPRRERILATRIFNPAYFRPFRIFASKRR